MIKRFLIPVLVAVFFAGVRLAVALEPPIRLELVEVNKVWGQNVTPGEWISGDASGDGFVGGDDLDWVRTHWGQGTAPLLGVPEPRTLVLIAYLLIFGPAFLARSRHHLILGLVCNNYY